MTDQNKPAPDVTGALETARKQRAIVTQGCQRWLDTILPPGAPVVQRVELRKAFFAGAAYMFHAQQSLMTGIDEVDQTILQNIDMDLKNFDRQQAEARKHR